MIKQRLIHPFKIKGEGNGFAYPAVGKYRALNVKGQPLRILRRGVGVFIFNDIAVGKIAPDVAGSPVLGNVLFATVDGAGLKGFESDVVVQVIVVAQRIEIPAPAVDR